LKLKTGATISIAITEKGLPAGEENENLRKALESRILAQSFISVSWAVMQRLGCGEAHISVSPYYPEEKKDGPGT
jgi:hypothetical protein